MGITPKIDANSGEYLILVENTCPL